jgi:hypothetical protein
MNCGELLYQNDARVEHRTFMNQSYILLQKIHARTHARTRELGRSPHALCPHEF